MCCRRSRGATSRSAATRRDRAFRDPGITFQLSGEERPFPLDLVPRILPADEWRTIETGVRQRVLALEAFLADVYGPGRILSEGVIPRRLVVTSTNFQRAAAGIIPPRGVRVHVAGIDLVRDAEGRFRVLEDNLRTPSGISYVIENRRAMTRVFPELFASHRVRRVADYPTQLLEALRASTAPVDDPVVVVLTPGVHNAAYFEHSFLARQMGVELVEGSDLVCHDNIIVDAHDRGASSGSTSCTGASTTTTSTHSTSAVTRSSAVAGIVNAARAGNGDDRERGRQRRRRRQGRSTRTCRT